MPIEYDATRDALFRPEFRDTLFESGANYSEQQLAAETARLAYLRAEYLGPKPRVWCITALRGRCGR
jgi:hypothetical protein